MIIGIKFLNVALKAKSKKKRLIIAIDYNLSSGVEKTSKNVFYTILLIPDEWYRVACITFPYFVISLLIDRFAIIKDIYIFNSRMI